MSIETDYEGNPVTVTEGVIDFGYRANPEIPRAAREAKPKPTPGRYFVRAGRASETRFKPAVSGTSADGRPYSFPAKLEAVLPLTIVNGAEGEDEYAGLALNKYYRVSSEPVKRGTNVANYSTLTSALEAFGVPVPESGTVADVDAALRSLEGLTSQHPVYLSYTGVAKAGRPYGKVFVKMPDGTFLRFNERAFRRGERSGTAAKYQAAGGTWASVGYLVNPTSDEMREWTLDAPPEGTDVELVYANVEPTDDGFRP
jgi:hypothetical protein